jgi:hypothetical protein
MAYISVGYDGIVNEVQWAEMVKKVGNCDYGVLGVGDWKVTAVTGADRTVSIATGKGWGHGVYDEITSNVTLQLDSVSSGSRWDLIAVRRNWNGTGGATTVVKINGSATKEIPGNRAKGPGTVDEQPIALVRVQSGSTTIQEIVDLRCWSGNGGTFAMDLLALTYLDSVASTVTINSETWSRQIGAGSAITWIKAIDMGKIPLFGVGAPAPGNAAAPAGTNFLVQAGSAIVTTDSNSFGKITWPKPFPNGLLSCQLMGGDDTGFNDLNAIPSGARWGTSPANKTYVAFNIYGASSGVRTRAWPNKTVRIEWLAIGW